MHKPHQLMWVECLKRFIDVSFLFQVSFDQNLRDYSTYVLHLNN